jgi:hypothetical protein
MPEGQSARLHQVRNIAFSFKQPPLVARAEQLHDELMQDNGRIAAMQERARGLSKP